VHTEYSLIIQHLIRITKCTVLKRDGGEEKMNELELHIEEFEYDDGYGGLVGDLYITLNITADDLKDPSGQPLTEFSYNFVSATFFAVGNNGQELGEFEIEEDMIARNYPLFDLAFEAYEKEVA